VACLFSCPHPWHPALRIPIPDAPSTHSGADAFRALWGRISRSTAAVFSAALPHLKGQSEALGALPDSTFELLGLDYLVDSDMRPWLLEVNGTPSLAVDHEDPEIEGLIGRQKVSQSRDRIDLMRFRIHPPCML
jgi:hypothetical protein